MNYPLYKCSNQDGSVTIWAVVLCSICMMVAMSLADLGNTAKSLSMAQNAADAAALSAAYEVAHSQSDLACVSARYTAKKNSALVTSCDVSQDDVVIDVVLLANEKISATARSEIE